jgi:transposase
MNTDFRSLSKEVRRDRRKQAFKLLDTGHSKHEVANHVEVHFKTIEDWVRDRTWYEANNYQGRKRGNPNDQQVLDKNQQADILRVIKESTPDKEGVASFLWSRKAIGEYIQKKYAITLSYQRISDYTKRWGLSSQRPKKQAFEQDPEKIRTWLEETYPAIQKRAKQEGAVIHWGDETNLDLNTNYQRTYAPKGQTPVAKIPARKVSYSMVSSLTNQGKLRYMVYQGGMNARLFKIFLQRLIKDTDQKVFLILDNLKVHHAKLIQAWQKEHNDQIELFFPPSIRSTT